MPKTEYISLLDGGFANTTGMHVGQDLRRLEFISNRQHINLHDVLRIVQYSSTSKTVEVTGVIHNFVILNNFLQKYHGRKCNLETTIYEVLEQKGYDYVSPNLKFIDYEFTYGECSRSEVKLIFKK